MGGTLLKCAILVKFGVFGAGVDWALLKVWESRFESDFVPPDMGARVWNKYRLRFRGCENIIDSRKLSRNYGAGLLLPGEKPRLPLVLWGLILSLQLGQGLHPRDGGFVLALLQSFDLDLFSILKCEGHQSWNGHWEQGWV